MMHTATHPQLTERNISSRLDHHQSTGVLNHWNRQGENWLIAPALNLTLVLSTCEVRAFLCALDIAEEHFATDPEEVSPCRF